jgi:hypothetical protein
MKTEKEPTVRIENITGKGFDTKVFIGDKDVTRDLKPYMTTISVPADGPVTATIQFHAPGVYVARVLAKNVNMVFEEGETDDR